MMTLMVNGQKRQVEGPMGLREFLQHVGVRTSFVAVAYNGQVLRKEEYDAVTLKDGDVLEIVRPVGGG
jgi:sulfur carrier protein